MSYVKLDRQTERMQKSLSKVILRFNKFWVKLVKAMKVS
jgi:hypothetical protein